MAAPPYGAYPYLDAAHFQELARIAERGKLDSVFFADAWRSGTASSTTSPRFSRPITLLAAIAAVTERSV